MSNPMMVNPSLVPGNRTVFMSGNDINAKNNVRQLLQSFGWADNNIMDLGDITTARGTEMILPLWLRVWGKVQTPFFNFSIHVAQK